MKRATLETAVLSRAFACLYSSGRACSKGWNEVDVSERRTRARYTYTASVLLYARGYIWFVDYFRSSDGITCCFAHSCLSLQVRVVVGDVSFFLSCPVATISRISQVVYILGGYAH